MEQKLVLVNLNDDVLGVEEKRECHKGEGIMHRAYIILIFNKKNQLLIQKRSHYKELWPGFWDNSCSSHPKEKESYIESGERRLLEELGFTTDLTALFKFYYKALYLNIGAENELCLIMTGKYNGIITPNIAEVSEWRWVDLACLSEEMEKSSYKFTPWFLIAFELLSEKDYIHF
ncbi:MAG: isopentenyl-diphosphate Delta-isomerase [Thermodesulfobacteriota bacterium]|nr:isopentenyl-diphosphate Delta-isomerase [Thermodesulfobacteriota bacterium]